MITGKVIDNKFVPDHPEVFKLEFAQRNGKQVVVTVKALSKKTRLFKFLYGVVYPAFREFSGADTIEDVDLALKEKFFFDFKDNVLTGDQTRYLKSKQESSYEDLCKYVSDCVMYGNTEHQLGILSGEEYYQT